MDNMFSNKFQIFNISVTHPVTDSDELSDLKIEPNEDFWIEVEVDLKYENPNEYEVESYNCIVANPGGFKKYLESGVDNRKIRFCPKAIIVDEFDAQGLTTFLQSFFSLKEEKRENQIIYFMNQFDRDFDIDSSEYKFLLNSPRT